MLSRFKNQTKRWLVLNFPGLSSLYSTVDDPQEVPVQVAAYRLIIDKYLQEGDSVLDVGFGLGYGLKMMSEKAKALYGVEVDQKALLRAQKLLVDPKIKDLKEYDGYNIPFEKGFFDVVTCVDVIEHVPDYNQFLQNLLLVSKRVVVINTPSRLPEYTNPDGTPKNYWHLREWSFGEFDEILNGLKLPYEWNILNGSWEGPYHISSQPTNQSMALIPAIFIK